MSYADYDFPLTGIRPSITSRKSDALIRQLEIGLGQEGDYLGDRLRVRETYFDLNSYHQQFPHHFSARPLEVSAIFPGVHHVRDSCIPYLAQIICKKVGLSSEHEVSIEQEIREIQKIREGIEYLADPRRFSHQIEKPNLIPFTQGE